MVLLDVVEVVEVIHHDAVGLRQSLGRGIGQVIGDVFDQESIFHVGRSQYRCGPHIFFIRIGSCFEDPFSLRLLPEVVTESGEARYFNLGKSISDRGIFSVFWTDGKKYRVILAREMTPEETMYYERKNSELAS